MLTNWFLLLLCSIVLTEGAMATTWDTLDRYIVISTDTHAGADLYGYKPYLPAASPR